MHTDASDYGIGAYLFQLKDGVEQPIEFVSKSLAKEQLRWSTPEKEAFAILFAFTKLEHLLRDTFFTLRTDHKNLLYINSAGSQKVQRWKLRIQEYDFQIEHIAGINNIAADFLSRLCSRPVEEALQSAESTNTPQIEVDGQIQYNPLLLLREGREDPQITRKIASVHNSRAGHHGVERTIELLYRQNERGCETVVSKLPSVPKDVVSPGPYYDTKVHHIDTFSDATAEHRLNRTTPYGYSRQHAHPGDH